MPEALTLSEIKSKVLEHPVPILFPDTCSLLDLIRIPFREKDSRQAVRQLQAAQIIHENIAQKNVWVILPSLIKNEWHDNEPSTSEELGNHLTKIDRLNSIVIDILEFFNNPLPCTMKFADKNIEQMLRDISKSLLDKSIAIQSDPECEKKAYSRVIGNKPPATKGGQLKDCTIIEHIFELTKLLDLEEFEKPRVFLSSNTNDYCINRTILKPELATEFESCKLSFSNSWEWANNQLSC